MRAQKKKPQPSVKIERPRTEEEQLRDIFREDAAVDKSVGKSKGGLLSRLFSKK